MKKDALDVDTEISRQMIIVENFGKTHDAAVQAEYDGWPLPDGHPGLQTYLQYFMVNSSTVFRRSAPFIRINGNGDTHRSTDGSTAVMYKKLKTSTRKVEMGTFPLLHPYGDDHDPFDMEQCLQYKGSLSAGGSSRANGNMVKVYKLTGAKHWKRKLYRDNIFHQSVA